MAALPYIKSDTVIVQNADMPLIDKSDISLLSNSNSEAAIVTAELPIEYIDIAYGRVMLNEKCEFDSIVEFKELRPEQRTNRLFNTGIYKFDTELFHKYLHKLSPHGSEFYLPEIFKLLKQSNHSIDVIKASTYDHFHGINTMQELYIAEKLMQKRLCDKFLSNGVNIVDPDSVYFSMDTVIERDVIIEPNVIFKGNVYINHHAVIKSFSYLENCVIPEYFTVEHFSYLKHSFDEYRKIHVA